MPLYAVHWAKTIELCTTALLNNSTCVHLRPSGVVITSQITSAELVSSILDKTKVFILASVAERVRT